MAITDTAVRLIDATAREIHAAMTSAAVAANTGSRTRLADVPHVIDIAASMAACPESGRLEENGGGVAGSYGYAATTSRVGVAWFAHPNGTTHYIVRGDRKKISGRHVAKLFPDGVHPALLVYPELAGHNLTQANARKLPREGRRLYEACRENPCDALARMVFADWLEENGQTSAAASERIAARVATEVATVRRMATAAV